MELKTDEHIKKLNTFGVDAKAKNFAEIRSIEDLKQA
ncbi:MAG: UDP-N-acetylmuramate dehydrogenase, partial [Parasutterella sp.]|nr:UDP-N-acetylmuramate dehydrogenase [Parasutterella sp.]